jgi:hypothetical protein
VRENQTLGTTFVSVAGKGFWMRDSLLELWLRLLALHIEDPVEPAGSTETRIRDQWLLASRGFFMGCVPDALDEFVCDERGRAVVVAAIESLLGALARAPDEIDASGLSLLNCGQFTRPIERRKLIEVGHAFLGLIAGTLGAEPSDTSFMPGSG